MVRLEKEFTQKDQPERKGARITMISSQEEALYQINHTEQLYSWGEISKTALKEKLNYFLGVLCGYDYAKYEDERERINRTYGLDL